MDDILDRAMHLIRTARSHPDPERAMRALERQARPEDRHCFAMLWEGLALVLNANHPPEDDAP